jgi:hypothetical protein
VVDPQVLSYFVFGGRITPSEFPGYGYCFSGSRVTLTKLLVSRYVFAAC